MTRSKRAKRIARREYAEKHAGQPPRAQQPRPPHQVVAKRGAKQKAQKPIWARPEFTYAIYIAVTIIVVAVFAYWMYTSKQQPANAGEVSATPAASAVATAPAVTGTTVTPSAATPVPTVSGAVPTPTGTR